MFPTRVIIFELPCIGIIEIEINNYFTFALAIFINTSNSIIQKHEMDSNVLDVFKLLIFIWNFQHFVMFRRNPAKKQKKHTETWNMLKLVIFRRGENLFKTNTGDFVIILDFEQYKFVFFTVCG